jgi:hypothetical protein
LGEMIHQRPQESGLSCAAASSNTDNKGFHGVKIIRVEETRPRMTELLPSKKCTKKKCSMQYLKEQHVASL